MIVDIATSMLNIGNLGAVLKLVYSAYEKKPWTGVKNSFSHLLRIPFSCLSRITVLLKLQK